MTENPSRPYRQYMVAVPAILEAAGESKFCVSLLDPNETLTVTVSLKSQELNSTLMQMESVVDFHLCREFEVSCRDGLRHIRQDSGEVQHPRPLCHRFLWWRKKR